MRLSRSVSSRWLAVGAVAYIGLLPLILTHRAPSLANLALFLGGLIALLFVPGIFLVRLLRIPVRGLEIPLLGLSLGIASSNVVYWVAAYLGAIPLYLAWPLAALGGLLVVSKRNGGSLARNRVAIAPALAVLLLTLVVVAPMAILPQFAFDLATREDGSMQVGTQGRIRDGLLHMSVAGELTHAFPPQVPFVAGKPLNYHYGMDLLTAAFHRFTGIPTRELCLRYLPPLYLALLVLSVFCFTRRWLASFPAAILAAFLVVLGEDLSFIPGLLWNEERTWAAQFFRVPTVVSLYLINPMALAMSFLFTGLFCLERGQQRKQRRPVWMLLAGVHFALMGTFKVFAVVQVLAGLVVVGILNFKKTEGYWLKTFLTTVACVVIITAPVVVPSEEPVIGFKLDGYSRFLSSSLEGLRLSEVPGFRAAAEMYASRTPEVSSIAATLLLVMPLFIVGSFGMRVIGLPAMVKSLSSWRTAPPMSTFLAVFVVIGCVVTLSLKVTPLDVPNGYNNSVWFIVQSKYVAWLFTAQVVAGWFRASSPRLAMVGTLVIVLLVLPSSVQFFVRSSTRHKGGLEIPEAREAAEFLRREAPSGSVVLSQDQAVRTLVLATTRCRLPYHSKMFLSSFLRQQEERERLSDLRRFWRAWEGGSVRQDIAAKYEVSYVVSEAPFDGMASSFDNGTYRVYRLGFSSRR